MAEIPELPGCRAWAGTPNDALTELPTVAEHFILSYRDRGKPLPAGIAQSVTGQGKIPWPYELLAIGTYAQEAGGRAKDFNVHTIKEVDGQDASAKPSLS